MAGTATQSKSKPKAPDNVNKYGEVVPHGVTKLCLKCQKDKDLWADFQLKARSSDLHQPWCKACMRQYNQDRYNKISNKTAKTFLGQPGGITINAGNSVRVAGEAKKISASPAAVPVLTTQPPAVEENIISDETIATVTAVDAPTIEKAAPQIEEPAVSIAATTPYTGTADAPAPTSYSVPMPLPAPTQQEAPVKPFAKEALYSIVSFEDWATDPKCKGTAFVTRGFEAIVLQGTVAGFQILSKNVSGPQRDIDEDLSLYILRILTGDQDIYGMVYR